MSAQLSRVLRRVGVGQLTATCDHASNLAAASQLCRQAKSAGACLLCLPEAFSFIGAAAAETVAQAEPLDGPRLGAYRALAREHGLWLSLGGFHEAGAPGGRSRRVTPRTAPPKASSAPATSRGTRSTSSPTARYSTHSDHLPSPVCGWSPSAASTLRMVASKFRLLPKPPPKT